MEHDTIHESIRKGESVIIKGKGGKVGWIRHKDCEMFNYNKDRAISIKLKDYIKHIKLRTSDGYKKHKQQIIEYMKHKFNGETRDETGIITRGFILY